MSDLSALERETLAAIQSAPDEGALEAARVAALGKKGSISALLATLGKLAPDERKTHGAAIRHPFYHEGDQSWLASNAV